MVMGARKMKAVFAFPRCLGLRVSLPSGNRVRRRRRGGRKGHEPAPRRAEWRDWAALPAHVLCAILERFQSDVLRGTGAAVVCKSWRRVAVEESLLWERIDLTADEDKDMARAAVDRSAGRCESFRGRVDGDFLVYLADRAPLLRGLHVTSWFKMGDDNKLGAKAMEKLPLLEQLVVESGIFDHAMLCAVLDHCPRLRLLDAGGCYTFNATRERLLARCQSRIQDLRLPRMSRLGGCRCRGNRAQKYADQHPPRLRGLMPMVTR